ncbi:unnamed protein product [Effrenium voratum]|uniref:ShKT domain-containing protein n=1 Tax=Effrenium voratum TaxID=2562239 RepID=A0AA36MXN3_9DINO|nr:unnamed protein product [Effrenium voratum]CAJ1429926.1 unnamed protein product [Effrenium voratum]
MSAVKLEKTIAQLERRLLEELQTTVEPLVARLDYLEGLLQGKKPSEKNVELEVDLPGETREFKASCPVVPTAEPSADGVEFAGPVRKRQTIMKVEVVDEEPIPFAETVWNVTLVLGHTGAGWLDVASACFLTLLSTFMQVVFTAVILSDYFRPASMFEQTGAAQKWRSAAAHDVKHMDLSLTSLVSRVCNDDGSLILSTGQAGLINEINQFVGMKPHEFAPTSVPPGMTMCMMCIMLWCIYLGGELRAVLVSLMAANQIPRGRNTVLIQGAFSCISRLRFLTYCLVRLTRFGIAICLLYAGILWLALTTNITDLILNAVALGAILQIDELVFAALFPKKIQVAIYELESVRVKYTKRWSQLESALVILVLTLITVGSFLLWVQPLTDQMLLVKQEYCAGNQDFVVGLNQDWQTYMGFESAPFGRTGGTSLGELAALEHSKQRLSNGTATYIQFSTSLDAFEIDRVKPLEELANEFPHCLDYDGWFPELVNSFGAIFRSAAALAQRPAATSCAQLKDLCDLPTSRALRFVCGETCGCDDPQAQRWFRVPRQGCPAKCEEKAKTAAGSLPCEDVDWNNSVWRSFWDIYPSVLSARIGKDVMTTPLGDVVATTQSFMLEVGCPGIAMVPEDSLTQGHWCAGSSELWAPLAHLCPVSCSCQELGEAADYCPATCSCADAPVFPAQGGITSCEEAVPVGICRLQFESKEFCAKTCDLCGPNATNSSFACMDGRIPTHLGVGNCSDIRAAGYCESLRRMDSNVAAVCSKSCGLCSEP